MNRPVEVVHDEFEGVTTTTFSCMTGHSRAPRTSSAPRPTTRRPSILRPIAELLDQPAESADQSAAS